MLLYNTIIRSDILDSSYEVFGSSAELLKGSINCSGSEYKLYDKCFNISECNGCSHAVLHCQPGMRVFC